MSFSSLVKRWIGKRQWTIRNCRPGPIQTRNKIGAPRYVKLMLEILEDRLAPTASVSLNTINTVSPAVQELDFTADPNISNVTITVTAPSSNQLKIVIANDTMSLAGGLKPGDLDGTNTTLTINTGSEPVTTINMYLPDGTDNNTGDTLSFGLTNSTDGSTNDNSTGINTVNIGANPNANGTPPTPGTAPTTDATDTVNLYTMNLGNISTLNASAGTISFASPQVQVSAENVTLTSANSLTFATTGMPFQGAVTVNAAPLTGQPFANDEYVTGPDWGALGYAPNDWIEWANPAGATETAYQVAGIVGDNLYLDTTSGIKTNSDPDATVSPDIYTGDANSFTPQIAANFLTLNVTQPTATISGAFNTIYDHEWVPTTSTSTVAYGTLNATTTGGNISLQNFPDIGDVSHNPPTSAILELGTLNAGTGTIQLDVNGGITALGSSTLTGSFSSTSATVNLPNTSSLTLGESVSGPGIPSGDTIAAIGPGASQVTLSAPTTSAEPSGVNLTFGAIKLAAGAVDLVTTGVGGDIGSSSLAITTSTPPTPAGEPPQSLQLTAATNDGAVSISDSSPGGLTINSIVADQGGQAATVEDGEVLYSSTPSEFSTNPNYMLGDESVTIGSTGPVVLNSVTATGDVTITGAAILEGDAQSANVVAPQVDLTANGEADYQEQVTFANTTNNTSGDTLTLPAGQNWTSYGFLDGTQMDGDPIVVAGATAAANNGTFSIQSISGSTLTLQQSYVLAPETQPYITVGDGMIGQANAAISLSDVPLFSATTANGGIYLGLGSTVDSTAVNVNAGGMNGVDNNVSVTSQANFLGIQDIVATGTAAVTANSGALLEFPSGGFHGVVAGQTVSLTSPYNIGTASDPFVTAATQGLTVAATATSRSSAAIDVQNLGSLSAVGVSTYDGSVNIQCIFSSDSLSFNNNVLLETGNAVVTFTNTDDNNGSAGNVAISGTVNVSAISAGIGVDGTAGAGQILQVASSNPIIDGNGGTVVLSAGSGIGIPGGLLDIQNVATLDATTTTGGIYIQNTSNSAIALSASTSNGNIDVMSAGEIDLSDISNSTGESVYATGTVTIASTSGAIVDANGATVYASTLMLAAADGIGTSSSPLETSSPGTLYLTASAGESLFLDSNTALTVNSAKATNGDVSITATGNLILLGDVAASAAATLTATDGALTTGNITYSRNAVTATGQQVITPAIMEPYITVGANLVINAGQADAETVTVTAVTATTFTATFADTHLANFTIGSANSNYSVPPTNIIIGVDSLTIAAEQIGFTSDVVQIKGATTIDATANYGGIYLSNDNGGVPLTLSAAAVGPTLSTGPTNNIEIYSEGNIILRPQTTTLTQLATTLPVAVLNPGGALTLLAGETLPADGNKPVIRNGLATITSAGANTQYYDLYTGTYIINGADQTSNNDFSIANGAGLDTTFTTQSGTFAVDAASQTATATDTSGPVNLATSSSISSVNESATVTINGTLAQGDDTGLVARFSSPNTYYYGSIAATSTGYMACIYSVINGTATPLLVRAPSFTGSVSNAVLEFTVQGSVLTLTLNGSVVASTTDSTITSAGAVGILSNSGDVSFSDFSSAPSLQIVSNTTEVLVTPAGTVPLLQLSANDLKAGGTFIAGTIEIEDLGVSGQSGTAYVGGDLVLDATAGGIEFDNPEDTIDASGTITIMTNEVADLGNLGTTGNLTTSAAAITTPGSVTVTPAVMEPYITVGAQLVIDAGQADAETVTVTAVTPATPGTPATFTATFTNTHTANFTISNSVGANLIISAGGNISVGTINAGATGTVTITSSSGAVYDSNGSNTLSITASLVALHSAASTSSGQSASSVASAAQSASIQAQLNAAEAAATAQAAAALAAADQTTAAAFKTALSHMQAALVIDNQNYQADVQKTYLDSQTDTTAQNVVNGETDTLDVLDAAAATAQVANGILSVAQNTTNLDGDACILIPFVGTVILGAASAVGISAGVDGEVEGSLEEAASAISFALIAATNQLNTDNSNLAQDQANEAQAGGQLQADTDTETAFAAAYNLAEQDYTSALATSNQDQAASQSAEQAAAAAEANATAASQAASVGSSTPSSAPTLNVTGPPTSSPPVPAPAPVVISNVQGALNWTNSIDSNSAVTEKSQGSVTVSGVTIQADSITITADGSDAGGATVTVDGTLIANSASIGVDPNSPGLDTFDITPSATTPITVTGGKGTDTLNLDSLGQSVTISGNTITVGTCAPVTFNDIAVVNITDAAGGASFTLSGTALTNIPTVNLSDAADGASLRLTAPSTSNTMNLVGTGPGAGTATLNGLAISFSGMTSFHYQGGGAGDKITVTPFVTSRWNLAVSVDGGSGTLARLIYNSVDSLADTVTATGPNAGTIASQGQATVGFSNVDIITTNAVQSPGAQLTVNLPGGSSPDTATLGLLSNGTPGIDFGVFGLNVDMADYTTGLTINGNSQGPHRIDLVPSAGVALSIPLTLNYPGMHSVVNTGAASTVEATASDDTITVGSDGVVEVADLFGNVSEFAATDTQLVLSDLGNNDTINVAGNNPFTNGIDVDGNASFSDILNDTLSSNAAVTVTPGTSTINQSSGGNVFYAGIKSVNLNAPTGATSTLTVNGSATAEAFDFTQTSTAAGSFTVAGPGESLVGSPLFSYTGFGGGVTVEGGTSVYQPPTVYSPFGHAVTSPGLSVGTMTGTLATVTGYSCVNESVSAMMTLAPRQHAGLVARYSPVGGQNMDLGVVVAGKNTYTAYIYRIVNGTPTSLFSHTYSGSVAADSTLTFGAVGSSLILSLGGKIIGSATDTILASRPGSVGMWTSSGAVMSNFVASAVMLQTAGHPFTDNFTTSSADGTLSTYWSNRAGAYQVNTSGGTGTATAVAPVNLATVNGINAESVGATITLKTGQYAGLVTRYAGSGVQNMYFGEIVAGSGTYTAYIYHIVNGVWKKLAASQTVKGSVTGAVLEFAVSGTLLTLTLNGTRVATATDSTLTAAGSVGMLSSGGATISSFSAD